MIMHCCSPNHAGTTRACGGGWTTGAVGGGGTRGVGGGRGAEAGKLVVW